MRLSEFRHRTVKIPAPSAQFTVSTLGSGTIDAAPLGNFEISYTLVDKDNRHTAHAPPVAVTLDRHWHIVVKVLGLPFLSRAVAYCVWWRPAGSLEWRVMGCQQFAVATSQVETPYLPFCGTVNHRYRGHFLWLSGESWPKWSNSFWLKGSAIPAPSTPLAVKVFFPPKFGFQAAWSWACDQFESGLSSVCNVEPAPQGERHEVRLGCHASPPNGAHGRFLYVRKSSTSPWHRQKANDGSWMWPLHSNHMTCHEFVETNVAPNGGGLSTLHPIQWMIEYGDIQHIEVDSDIVLTSPLVNPYREIDFYRTISAPNGRQWKLQANHYGPIFLEGNQRTRLVGAHLKSSTASAGIDFIDVTGGGAFHFRGERVRIDLFNPNGSYQDAYAVGVMDDSKNAVLGQGDHSCSEPVFTDLQITAKHPCIIEGAQSANWNFENVDIWGGTQSDNAAFVLNSSNHLVAQKRVTADQCRALLAVVSGKQVRLENVWIDIGIPQWFVVSNRAEPTIDCTFARAHHHYGLEQHVLVETAKKVGGKGASGSGKGEFNGLPKVVFPESDTVPALAVEN